METMIEQWEADLESLKIKQSKLNRKMEPSVRRKAFYGLDKIMIHLGQAIAKSKRLIEEDAL